MKVLAISGSRNPEGQTAEAVNALLSGVQEAGSEAETLFLPQMDVQRCRQCGESCWGICWTEHKCIIDDDYEGIVEKIRDADALVFASPVYFGDLSESMKALLDRLRRCSWKAPDQVGTAGKPTIGIAVAGGGGGGAPYCTVNMEEILDRCSLSCVDFIAVRRQNKLLKQKILKETGKWLVTADHVID